MKLEIPKFHETFDPILAILQKQDNISRAKLREMVIENFFSNIPKDLLEQRIKSGELLIHNRINWGISYLKQAGYLFYPKRGFVQLTEKGKNQKDNLNLAIIKQEIEKLNPFLKKD